MLFSLIKINLRSIFVRAFSGGKVKNKPRSVAKLVLITLLALYCIGVLLFMVGLLFNTLAPAFFDSGYGWLYFSIIAIMSISLGFIGTVFAAGAQLFEAKDNELLISMPIKPRAILAGRLATLLLLEYMFQAMIVLPALVVWYYHGYATALGTVYFITASLCLPLLTLSLVCVFAWLVTLITSRMRSKKLFTYLLCLVFIGAYIWVYANINRYVSSLVAHGEEIAGAVKKAMPPIFHYGNAPAQHDFMSLIIFMLCSLIPFLIVCDVLSRTFVKLITTKRGAKKIKYREKKLAQSGVVFSLTKKEMRLFFSLPMYVLNAALGAAGILILSGILIVKPAILTGPISELTAAIPVLTESVVGVVILMLLASMCYVSAPSVSLEGKSIWIPQSLPVRARDVLVSKALSHIIIIGVPTVIGGIVAGFVMNGATLLLKVLAIVSPMMLVIFLALLGVVINVKFPRLNWINPVMPIKQGLSSIFTTFGGMMLVIILAVVYAVLLSSYFSLEIYILLVTVLFSLLSILFYRLLVTSSSAAFERIG